MNFDNFNVERASELCEYGPVPSDQENGVIHDDGAMHVRYNHVNYGFEIGQELSSQSYNRQANWFLREIGVQGNVSGSNN